VHGADCFRAGFVTTGTGVGLTLNFDGRLASAVDDEMMKKHRPLGRGARTAPVPGNVDRATFVKLCWAMAVAGTVLPSLAQPGLFLALRPGQRCRRKFSTIGRPSSPLYRRATAGLENR
jgi:hypothetical protein